MPANNCFRLTLHYMNQDILRMGSFATSQDLLAIKRRIDQALGVAQETKDKYNNHFRVIDTQRHWSLVLFPFSFSFLFCITIIMNKHYLIFIFASKKKKKKKNC